MIYCAINAHPRFKNMVIVIHIKQNAKGKTAVSLMVTHWGYCSFALWYRNTVSQLVLWSIPFKSWNMWRMKYIVCCSGTGIIKIQSNIIWYVIYFCTRYFIVFQWLLINHKSFIVKSEWSHMRGLQKCCALISSQFPMPTNNLNPFCTRPCFLTTDCSLG